MVNMGEDDNWSEDTLFVAEVTEFKGLPRPITNDEVFMIKDKPDRILCNVCGKERTVTRCNMHILAKGCNYCHMQKEHLE